jgi:hypothetical protein
MRPDWSVVLGVPGADCSMTDLQPWGTALVGLHGHRLWRSPDGVHWESLPLPGGPGVDGRRLLPLGDALLVFGIEDDRLLGWRTTDLADWVRVDLPRPPERWARRLYSIEATARLDSGRMLVVASARGMPADFACESTICPDRSVLWTSDDGTAWTVAQPTDGEGGVLRDAYGSPYALYEVVAAPGRFLAPGPSLSILGSPDGVAWSVVGSRPDHGGLRYAWSAVGDYLLAAGTKDMVSGTPIVIRSSDLTTWEVVADFTRPDWVVTAVASGPAGDLVVGSDARLDGPWMYSSSDAATWAASAVPGIGEACGSGASVTADAFYGTSTCDGPSVWRAASISR